MIKKRFARKSDVDGKGMNSGYIFNNGEYYCQTQEQAMIYIKKLGLNWVNEIKKFVTKNEWFFYTEWEDLDEEEYFDEEGKTYRICFYCKKETSIDEDFYFCKNCLKQL